MLELETAGRGTGRLSSMALPQLIGCDGSSEIRALNGASGKILAGLLELDAAQRRQRSVNEYAAFVEPWGILRESGVAYILVSRVISDIGMLQSSYVMA